MPEYEIGKWSRDLPYPLKDAEFPEYSENNAGEVVQAAPAFFNPDEPDEVIDIHFRMSMSQFTAIASAIDIGRDIGFGERSYELWRTWCKALIGEITVACEDIADCIETNEVTQEAIATAITNNTTIQNSIVSSNNANGFGNPNNVNYSQTTPADRNPSGAFSEPIATLADCDLNSLWGAIRHGIVQRLDDVGRDLLDDLATINDLAERLQAFVSIVPVVGSMIEGVAEQITEIIPDIQNLYDSYSSEAQMDIMACEIFALVCSDCRYPTFEEIFDYYRGLAGIPDSLSDVTLELVAEHILELILAPAETAYGTMQVFALFTLAVQALFNGLNGTRAVALMIELGEDFGNDNWLALCATCNEQWQIKHYNFMQSPSGWQLQPQIGSQTVGGRWQSGTGWLPTEPTTGTFVCRIVIDIQPSWRVRGFGFHLSNFGSVVLANTGASFRPTPGSNTGVVNMSFTTGTNYNRSNCLLAVNQGYQQITIVVVANDLTPAIEKAFITYDAGYGEGERAASRAIC